MIVLRQPLDHMLLDALIARVRGGSGQAVLVDGPKGSGKSRLVTTAADQAARAGLTVRWACCSRFDAPGAPDGLGVLGRLGLTDDVFGPHPVRQEGCAGPSDDGDGQGGAPPADAVRQIVRVSRRRPVMIGVDDLGDADPELATLVERLATTIVDERVLLVVTGSGADAARTWAAVADHPHCQRVSLPPPAAPERQAAQASVRQDGRLPVAHEISGGDIPPPRVLLADYTAGPRQAEPTVGGAYRAAVIDCLRRLDPAVREIAEAIAAVGELTPDGTDLVDWVATVLRSDRAAVERSAARLLSSGLVHTTGFRHCAGRDAVLSDMSPNWLRTLRERAIATLGRGQPRLPEPARFPVLVADRAHRMLSIPTVEVRRLSDARRLMNELEQELPRLAPADRVELEATRLLLGCEFPSLLSVSAPQPVPEGRAADSARFQAAWSLTSTLTRRGADDAAQAARAALGAFAVTEEHLPAILAALGSLACPGTGATATEWCDRLIAEARRQHRPQWQARLLAVRASDALYAGAPVTAIADCEAALALLPAVDWDNRLGALLAIGVTAHTMQGDNAAAAQMLAITVPEQVFESRYGVGYLYARGHHHLAMHRHDEALRDFLHCGRLLLAWGLDRHDLVPWRFAATAAHLLAGRHDRAIDLIDEKLAQPAQRDGVPQPAVAERGRAWREAVFEELLESTGTERLHPVISRLQRGSAVRALPVARYKIHDRHSAYLDKLSPSERRVAVLAARGSTNQRIANDLSITISTVEQHLTRTYRKLGMAGRTELRAKLG